MILGGKLPGKVGRCRFFYCPKGKYNRQHRSFPGKYGFPQSERRCRREGNRETRRIEPARYMDVAGFLNIWLHGQAVKTPPFHGGNPSSILGGVTI